MISETDQLRFLDAKPKSDDAYMLERAAESLVGLSGLRFERCRPDLAGAISVYFKGGPILYLQDLVNVLNKESE